MLATPLSFLVTAGNLAFLLFDQSSHDRILLIYCLFPAYMISMVTTLLIQRLDALLQRTHVSSDNELLSWR